MTIYTGWRIRIEPTHSKKERYVGTCGAHIIMSSTLLGAQRKIDAFMDEQCP